MESLILFAQDAVPAAGSQWMIDAAVFFLFLLAVVIVGIGMGRQKSGSEENSESYFLAGRGLAWWLIGFSLIAANISTEQFVGMSGQAAMTLGLAIASYEWLAAVSLIVVAFLFLPKFLKAGVYTIPEFLETRYNKAARTLMSLTMMATFASVNIAVVTYSGAKAYSGFFKDMDLHSLRFNIDSVHPDLTAKVADAANAAAAVHVGTFAIPLDLTTFGWMIGIIAALYVFMGGLKACAWADLLQGSALIVCGAMILYFALGALGKADKPTLETAMQSLAVQAPDKFTPEKQAELLPKLENANAFERFTMLNGFKLRMNLPWTDGVLPITALLFGIWIPNLYYWGLNQYIMQRTLGSQSLSQGQKGIVFAAFLKLLIPFIVIFPGLIAFNLYSGAMKDIAQSKVATPEKYDSLVKEYTAKGNLFTFDQDFVRFQPEVAGKMVKFNADKEGFTVPDDLKTKPLEALAAMKADFSKRALDKQPKYGETFSGYNYDSAFALLMQRLVPQGGLRGFVLAALLGAIISTLASLFNATSTIFAMDIYKEYLHKNASERTLVLVGRLCVIAVMIFGCWLAPMLDDPKFGGVFTFIQEFQGFISPGILAAFLFGFVVSRAPRMCGLVALLLNPIIYGSLKLFASQISFLDRMSISFVSIILIMSVMTLIWPLKTPFKQELKTNMDMRTSKTAVVIGILIVLVTAAMYAYFWDHQTPMFEGFSDWIGKLTGK